MEITSLPLYSPPCFSKVAHKKASNRLASDTCPNSRGLDFGPVRLSSQQPTHPFDLLLSEFLGTLQERKEAPVTVGQTGVEERLGLDAVLFSQNSFVHDGFVSEDIHAVDLEECRWESSMALAMVEWGIPDVVVVVGLVPSHEHVHGGTRKDGGILVLLIGVHILLVLLGYLRLRQNRGDGKILSRQRRGQVLVASYMSQNGTDVATGRCAAHDETGGRIGAPGFCIGCRPP